MKRISHKRSRRNNARRRRKVQARHGKAEYWSAHPRPVLSSGRLHQEIGANTEAMSYGSIGAVHGLVTKLGLPKQMDERVQLLKVHLPYHESDQVLNLPYNVLGGRTRLEDMERLRHDIAYLNALGAELIPDPTTAGDFCRRFAEEDILELRECVNAVRLALWRSRARELLEPVAYINMDGTEAPTYGEKKASRNISYKGTWGYAPLILSPANTKEVLYRVHGPGNVPSHTGAIPLDR